jgi:hypothetical protein
MVIVDDVKLMVDTVPGDVPAVIVALVPLRMLVPLNLRLKTRLVEPSEVNVVK